MLNRIQFEIRNYMPLQRGDVKQTLSNTKLLSEITGYKPTLDIILASSEPIDPPAPVTMIFLPLR